jgi:hypothetical protein
LKLNILIIGFIATIVSLMICGVWDFPLTFLNLVNIIYCLGMKMEWHGKERHGMECKWKWKCIGKERKGKAMEDKAWHGMAWKVKEMQGEV